MAKRNGSIIGIINTPTTTTATGVWRLQDQFNARKNDIWPGQPVIYSADFLVIAGGGAGRGSRGGGGGAGGYRNSFSTEPSGGGGPSEATLSLITGVSYTITVGAGGTGTTGTSGTSGVDSSISGSNITTITSSGGGYGNGTTGGSGGGGAGSAGNNGGPGTANQGRAGGNGADFSGGGGGGADTAGSNGGYNVGGAGGNGLSSSITASSVARGGGGGGCAYAGTVNVVEVAFDVNANVVLPVSVIVTTPAIALSISCKLTLVSSPQVPEFSPVACRFKPKLLNVLAILNSPYHFYCYISIQFWPVIGFIADQL